MTTDEHSDPEHASTQGLAPVVSAGYGGAVSTIAQTWSAGVPLVLVMLVGTLVSFAVIAAAGTGAVVVAGIGIRSAAPAYMALAFAMYFGSALLVVGALMASLAPSMQALYRAHARHVVDEEPLTVKDGVRGSFGSHQLNVFLAVAMALETIGYVLFLVPGVLVSASMAFVAPAMVVHNLPLGAAMRRSLHHFWQAPLWHLGLALIDVMIGGAIASAIPLLGTLVMLPMSTQLHLQAYLAAYPREPEVFDL